MNTSTGSYVGMRSAGPTSPVGVKRRTPWVHVYDGPGEHWRGGEITRVTASQVEITLLLEASRRGVRVVDRAWLPADVPALVHEPLACRVEGVSPDWVITDLRRGTRPASDREGPACLNGVIDAVPEWQPADGRPGLAEGPRWQWDW